MSISYLLSRKGGGKCGLLQSLSMMLTVAEVIPPENWLTFGTEIPIVKDSVFSVMRSSVIMNSMQTVLISSVKVKENISCE